MVKNETRVTSGFFLSVMVTSWRYVRTNLTMCVYVCVCNLSGCFVENEL